MMIVKHNGHTFFHNLAIIPPAKKKKTAAVISLQNSKRPIFEGLDIANFYVGDLNMKRAIGGEPKGPKHRLPLKC